MIPLLYPKNLLPKLENIKESINKGVLSKQLSADISKNMEAFVRQSVQDSFMTMIVPTLEKAVRDMFGQMSEAFDRGLQSRILSFPFFFFLFVLLLCYSIP